LIVIGPSKTKVEVPGHSKISGSYEEDKNVAEVIG
jgi:hypothetical protein